VKNRGPQPCQNSFRPCLKKDIKKKKKPAQDPWAAFAFSSPASAISIAADRS